MASTGGTGPGHVLKLGLRVQVAAGQGHVRFVGQTSFAAGKWVGVELDEAVGKNDGSVNGKRYFTTNEQQGVFVRPSQVRVLDRETLSVRSLARPPSTTQARIGSSLGVQRPSSTNAAATGRASAAGHHQNATDADDSAESPPRHVKSGVSVRPTSSATSSSIDANSPTLLQQDTFRVPQTPSSTHTRKPSVTMQSMLPPPSPSRSLPRPIGSATTRKPASISAPAGVSVAQSFAPAGGGTSSFSGNAGADGRPNSQQGGPVRRQGQTSTASVEQSVASPSDSVISPQGQIDSASEKHDPFSLKGPDARRPSEMMVPRREYEELQTKLRILESRRAEDRDRLRLLDKLQDDAQEWDGIKEKTKSKIAELAGDIKDLESERNDLAAKLEELQDQVELSLLDKEMAEEKHEAMQASLEATKEKFAELEVEVQVLREENVRMTEQGNAEIVQGPADGQARSNLAFVQLEKQNERLREALLRMRDLTSESEAESKRKIADLEKELDLTSDLQTMYDNNVVELERAESQIEDLKAQLDDALGAEDLLEQLTERNLSMSERIEEMKTVIEDLEALKELNDELEESHVETERQMQEELDVKDLQIRQMAQKSDSLEDSVAEYEITVGQFRELVRVLQSDIESMRKQQATRETESQTLTSQSQAMLNLNMKLQSSVQKSQVKAIDLELRKLDALQASTHLEIVRPYLLPTFFDEDGNAVETLLFFERIAFKADLVGNAIEQKHNISDSLYTTVPETLIGACEARSILARYAGLNRRFASVLRRCDPDAFIKMGQIHVEVVPTEKRIDAYIDALRKESLVEVDCAHEVAGLVAQLEHLAELYLQGSALELAERQLAFVSVVDLDFDTIAAATGFAKQAVAIVQKESDALVDASEEDMDVAFYQPVQNLINQARTAKAVTKKLLRKMQELIGSSSALALEHAAAFETLAFNSSTIAGALSKLANQVAEICSNSRSSRDPLKLASLLGSARDVAAAELGKQSSAQPFNEILALLSQLAQDIGTTLTTAGDQEHIVKLDYEPPWFARVAKLQSTAAVNIEAEHKVAQLNEEMRDLVREMRSKEQLHQESVVKIELMEKRIEDNKKQADAMTELQAELQKSKKQERAYEEAVETLQNDLDTMEKELTKLKQSGISAEKQANARGEEDATVYEGNMETSYLVEQIQSLRGSLRYLRQENAFIKSQDLATQLDALPSLASSRPTAVGVHRPESPTTFDGIPKLARQDSNLAIPTDARAFAVLSKSLMREARLLSCSPRLIDVSRAKQGGQPGWQPKLETPRGQLQAEKDRVRRLKSRVQQLVEARPFVMAVR
ncbi:hypothetical protein OIO90_002819 [Microbotryomycetes sp. JL221]|nr:hypothetical protein OIO90_002819 [Microbotryomycetes sp. JL221]